MRRLSLAPSLSHPSRAPLLTPFARARSLFQIVVDTDATATQILDRMVQDKSGRVTFMPLNRLRVHDHEYPKTTEAIPMCVPFTSSNSSASSKGSLTPPLNVSQDQQAQVR